MGERKAWQKRGNPNRHQQGYGSSWDKLRKVILERDNHLCQMCLAKGRPVPGNQCDHKIPKAKGGTDDPSNLWILCKPYHLEKTLRENGRRSKPITGVDGWPVER
mgnify:CR=1 FL=1